MKRKEPINQLECSEKMPSRKVFEYVSLLGPATFLERLVPKGKLQEYLHFTRANARDFLLLRLLTEVQKLGFVLERWNGFLDRTSPELPHTAAHEQMLESLVDEQSLWQRKLVEGLTLLINFTRTNTEIHYYHFLLLHELERYRGMLKEQQDFFGHRNSLTQKTVNLLTERITAVETEISSLAECWYLPALKPVHKRRDWPVLASLRQQLKVALPDATRRERTALCYTYGLSYAETSDNLHFTPIRLDHTNLEKRFSFGVAQCGVLSVAILQRAHDLTGLNAEGINAQLMNLDRDASSESDPTFKKMEIGDFVLAGGPFLGEVVSVNTSVFGYESYQVKYLADTPLEDVKAAWFPSVEVELFIRRKEIKDESLAELTTEAHKASTTTLSISDEELELATRDAVIEMWRAGLNTYFKRSTIPKRKGDRGLGYEPEPTSA